MDNICGADCNNCYMKEKCKGCLETNGHPFGGNCVLASCCHNRKDENTSKLIREYKDKAIEELNALNIKDMPKVTELYALNGSFINMEYNLNGQTIKFWNDNDIYLGNQLEKKDSNRCFGITVSDDYLLVCEYSENGVDPEIIVFKKR